MADFKEFALSAEDLIRRRRKIQKIALVKGEKIFVPTGSWLEGKQVQTLLLQTKELLEIERVERLGSISQAEWDDKLGFARVTKCVGRQFEKFGFQENSILYLYPEEALFLVESNRLDLRHGGVSMSLQQAFNSLLSSKTNFSFLEYRVFSHFVKHGFKLLRHSPKRTITAYERQIGLHPAIERIKYAKSRLKGIDITETTCSSKDSAPVNNSEKTKGTNSNLTNKEVVTESSEDESSGNEESSESSESEIEIVSDLCGASKEVKGPTSSESSSADDSDCQVVSFASGGSKQGARKQSAKTVKDVIEVIDLDDSSSESRVCDKKELEVGSIKIESCEPVVMEGVTNSSPKPCDANLCGSALLKSTKELLSVCDVKGRVQSILQASSPEDKVCDLTGSVQKIQELSATYPPCLKVTEQKDTGGVSSSEICDTNSSSVPITDTSCQNMSQQSINKEDKPVIECNKKSVDLSQEDKSNFIIEESKVNSGEILSQNIPDNNKLPPRDYRCESVIQENHNVNVKSEIKLENKSELPLTDLTDERNNSCIENLIVGNICEVETSNERSANICKIEKQAVEAENSLTTLSSWRRGDELVAVGTTRPSHSERTVQIEVVDLGEENSKENGGGGGGRRGEEGKEREENKIDEPHGVYEKDKVKEDRHTILESFPDCAGRQIIYCNVPSKHLLPRNVSPTRTEYKIVLRRLGDPRIGGRPGQQNTKNNGSRYFNSRRNNSLWNSQRPPYAGRQHNGRVRSRISHVSYFQGRLNDRPENSFMNTQNQQPYMNTGPWMRSVPEQNPWTHFPPERMEVENNSPWMNYAPDRGERQNNSARRDMSQNGEQNTPVWSNFPPEMVRGEHPPPWVEQRGQNTGPWMSTMPERGQNAPPWTAFPEGNTPPRMNFPQGRDQNAPMWTNFPPERRECEQNSPSLSHSAPETMDRNEGSPSWSGFPPEGSEGDGRQSYDTINRALDYWRYLRNSHRRSRGPRRRGILRSRGGRQDWRWSPGHSVTSQGDSTETNSSLIAHDGVVPNELPEREGGHEGTIGELSLPRNVQQGNASQDIEVQHIGSVVRTNDELRGQSGTKRRAGRSCGTDRGAPAKRLRSGTVLQPPNSMRERLRTFLEKAGQRPPSDSSSEESSTDVQTCSSSSGTTDSSSDEDEEDEDELAGMAGEEVDPLVKPEHYGNLGCMLRSLQIIPSAKLTLQKPLPQRKLQIKFDMYLPTTAFRKSEPPVPDYRVVIVRPQDDIPTAQTIALLLHGFEDGVPLLFALSSLDSVNVFMYSDVELPLVEGNERLF